MNSMKRQKDMTLKDEHPPNPHPPGWEVSNMLLEKRGEIAPEGMKKLSQSRNSAQLWLCLVVKVKCEAIKNNIA